MFEQFNDIMTIEDLCEALLIGRNRCYELLGQNEIQGFRIGSVWKIPKEAVITYVRKHSASKSLFPDK